MRVTPKLLVVIIALAATVLGLCPNFAAAESDVSIAGIRLGMPKEQVRNTLGIPTMEYKKSNSWGYRKTHKGRNAVDDPQVYFTTAGKVKCVIGSQLLKGKNVAAAGGQEMSKVIAAIGQPTSSAKPDKNGVVVHYYQQYDLNVASRGANGEVVVFGMGELPQ